MIAPGRYRARAADWDLGLAETGTEQVAVCFEIVEEGEFLGQRVTWFGFFTEGTQERTIKALQTCGWSGDDLANLVGLNQSEVELVIEHEQYQGQRRARVKWVNRVGAGGVVMKNLMNDANRKALAERMKGLVITMRKEIGTEQHRAAPTGRTASPPTRTSQPGREYPATFDNDREYGEPEYDGL
jgi:hypothetical protein